MIIYECIGEKKKQNFHGMKIQVYGVPKMQLFVEAIPCIMGGFITILDGFSSFLHLQSLWLQNYLGGVITELLRQGQHCDLIFLEAKKMKNEKKKQNFHVMKIQVYGSIIGGGLVIASNTQLPLGLDYLNLVWVWHGYVYV